MGLTPSGELIWGILIPMPEYDEPSPLFAALWGGPLDEDGLPEDLDDNDYESDLPGRLHVATFGHYQDDDPRGILTSKDVPTIDCDAWDPEAFDPATAFKVDKSVVDESQAAVDEKDIPADFSAAQWWATASYG